MSMLEKMNALMEKEGINKSQLSKQSGVPYTTIDGFYKKGTDNVKLSTLKRLAEYFNCSLDYLVDDEVDIHSTDNTDSDNDDAGFAKLVGKIGANNDELTRRFLFKIDNLNKEQLLVLDNLVDLILKKDENSN